jgi:F-type H+-transporting ATPase subunit delta
MKGTRAAIRYATAIFESSLESKNLERFKTDIDFVYKTCSDRSFVSLLRSPVMPAEVKIKVFRSLFEGAVSTTVLNFVELIAKNRREVLLPYICEEFYELYNHHNRLVEVTMTTAVRADEATKQEVLKLAGKLSSFKPILKEVVDESLIGGFILRVGDIRVDASVSGKLNKVRQELTKNVYSNAQL